MTTARNRPEEEVTTILMALIAWGGHTSNASRYLANEKQIEISPKVLADWKTRYGERYDDLREKFAGQLEGKLVHEMRDVARLALETERLAIEKAHSRLAKDEDQDPGRTAANLARVTQSSTDKMLSLSGRPTHITESRGVEELLRSLVKMGVIQPPEEPAMPELAAVVPDLPKEAATDG